MIIFKINKFMATMWEPCLSDSFDCDTELTATLKKSLQKCVKPKLISSLGKDDGCSFDDFAFLQTKSYEVLKNVEMLSFQQIPACKSDILPQPPVDVSERIKECIEEIKKTIIYDDSPVSICDLFRKSEYLANFNHQNKRPVKFFLIEQNNERNFMLIQKMTWMEFSLFDGKGLLLLPDGRKIYANWCNALPVGPCQIMYANKSVYSGPVNKHFQKHGHGYIYFSTGQKLEGEFKLGKLSKEKKYYNKNRSISKNQLPSNNHTGVKEWQKVA